MDKRYNILTQLYGEGPTTEPLRSLLKDESLHEEYQAFSEAKFALDHKDRVRPSPETLEAIFAAAATPVAPQPVPRTKLRAREDRQPARRRRFAMLPVSLAAVAVVAVVAIGLNVALFTGNGLPGTSTASQELAAESPAADVHPPTPFGGDASLAAQAAIGERVFAGDSMAADQVEMAASRAASASLESTGLTDTGLTDTALLAWDESGNVRMLNRRIQSLREANATLDWDEVAVPLEQLSSNPAARSAGALQTVGSRKNQ